MNSLKVCLIVLCLGMAVNARAIVSVKPSLTEDLFACNAGILHAGETLRGTDYIQVQYEDMTVPASHAAHFRGGTLESNPGNSSFQSLFSLNDIWNRRITALNFSFSTEKTGAAYFVDFCYLGPLEDLKNQGSKKKDESEGIYLLASSLTSTNLTDETSYRDHVKLQAKVDFACDLRGLGKMDKPRAPGETAPGGTENDGVSYNDLVSISSQGLVSEQNLNAHPQLVPRFCRFRAIFSEAQIKDRANNSANAEMSILLNVQKIQ